MQVGCSNGRGLKLGHFAAMRWGTDQAGPVGQGQEEDRRAVEVGSGAPGRADRLPEVFVGVRVWPAARPRARYVAALCPLIFLWHGS